eukprot:Lithocolla_globosa_v1_NODE_4160_length_1497_cov_2.176838.p2 type:complete len:120 gc:universal NODE_4160_length_1497_cov_2.176838:764-1123(+)
MLKVFSRSIGLLPLGPNSMSNGRLAVPSNHPAGSLSDNSGAALILYLFVFLSYCRPIPSGSNDNNCAEEDIPEPMAGNRGAPPVPLDAPLTASVPSALFMASNSICWLFIASSLVRNAL